MSNCEVFDFELCDIEIRTDQSKSRSENPCIDPLKLIFKMCKVHPRKVFDASLLGTSQIKILIGLNVL